MADIKLIVAYEKLQFVSWKLKKNIVGLGKITAYQHFLVMSIFSFSHSVLYPIKREKK